MPDVIDRKTAYRELLLISVLAVLQPITELSFGVTAAHYYNYLAVFIGLTYVIVRGTRHPSLWKTWGLRTDTFLRALPVYLTIGIVGGIILYFYGSTLGNTPLPPSFWIILVLYMGWGTAQQFALQNLLVRNLSIFLPSIAIRAILVALLFGAVHLPSPELFVLAGAFGFCMTLAYHKYPNILAAGLSHGIVGALVFYAVLGKDQWQQILQYFS